jgi:hypothetical protein
MLCSGGVETYIIIFILMSPGEDGGRMLLLMLTYPPIDGRGADCVEGLYGKRQSDDSRGGCFCPVGG